MSNPKSDVSKKKSEKSSLKAYKSKKWKSLAIFGGISDQFRIAIRAIFYVLIILLFLAYTVGAAGDFWVFSKCLLLGKDMCMKNEKESRRIGFRYGDSQDTDQDYEDSFSVGNLSTLIAMTASYWLSGVLSLLVVWVIDHSEHTTGFKRIIQLMCLAQCIMDFGFFIIALSFENGYYDQYIHNKSGEASLSYVVGEWLMTIGDVCSVVYTTVISLILLKFADQNTFQVDISRDISSVGYIIMVFGAIVATLQSIVCKNSPVWAEECPIVYVRGAITIICALVNAGVAIIVWRSLPAENNRDASTLTPQEMKIKERNEGVVKLGRRLWFYTFWTTFSRMGYIGLIYMTGTLNMNFADAKFNSLENIMSSLCYLLWLPTGTGYAVFYMYTHDEEWKFAKDTFWHNKPDAHYLPPELRSLWFILTMKLLGEDHQNGCIPYLCVSCGCRSADYSHNNNNNNIDKEGNGMCSSCCNNSCFNNLDNNDAKDNNNLRGWDPKTSDVATWYIDSSDKPNNNGEDSDSKRNSSSRVSIMKYTVDGMTMTSERRSSEISVDFGDIPSDFERWESVSGPESGPEPGEFEQAAGAGAGSDVVGVVHKESNTTRSSFTFTNSHNSHKESTEADTATDGVTNPLQNQGKTSSSSNGSKSSKGFCSGASSSSAGSGSSSEKIARPSNIKRNQSLGSSGKDSGSGRQSLDQYLGPVGSLGPLADPDIALLSILGDRKSLQWMSEVHERYHQQALKDENKMNEPVDDSINRQRSTPAKMKIKMSNLEMRERERALSKVSEISENGNLSLCDLGDSDL